MTTITKTGMPVSAGNITDLGLARDHVAFNTKWVGRYTTPISYMLMATVGKFMASRNKEIKMFQRTGIQRKYIATANFGAATYTNGTVQGPLFFDTYLGAGVDAILRPGLGFVVNGYTGDVGAGYAQSMQLTILSGSPVAGWMVRVDTATSSNGTTIAAFDFDGTCGQTSFVLVGSEPYVGQAPQGFSLTPDTISNFHQYFRVPFNWEHKLLTQDNLFTNLVENTREEAYGILLSQINSSLLRNEKPLKDYATDTAYNVSTQAGHLGTTEKRTKMGGLPWLIGYGVDANNMQGKVWNTKRWAAQTGPTMAVATPTATEARAFLDDLYYFGGLFDLDPRPYVGLVGWEFCELVRRCVVASGYNPSYSEGTIKFPQLELPYQEINLKNIRLRMVVEQEMNASEPHGLVRYTAALGGASILNSQVFAGNMMPVFNPTDIMLSYAIDDGGDGIRVPNVKPIDAVRNPNMSEMEYTAELTAVADNRHKMGVFHQRVGLV